ncbi:PH domain-containing protein [Tellurirhabdus bombi]|uniref:PH domain-containing protein n=1 Tax=Tellurirhabdus bombi TaxID=2907205 RepID=UPI001F48E70D|nr:PH domain-containing protein [Tellurirhabdus bombi]
MKVYKANRKGFFKNLILAVGLLLVTIIILDSATFLQSSWLLLPLLAPLGLLLWIYVDTYYQLEQTKLKYKSGFLKGEIDVLQIKEIVKGKTLWAGLKPALASKGLTIKYNRFDEIYIAPENNTDLLRDLLAINSHIVVKEEGK